jgi:hypothetical protein
MRFRKYAPNVEQDAGQERTGIETENRNNRENQSQGLLLRA